jgi:hypothetical protein
MALIGTIALVVFLVLLRLFLPPLPNSLSYFRRWGKRNTIVLCSISILLATLVIFLSRR